MELTALILGSGFAAQGHTLALRDAGVTVIGMVSRTAEVVERIAASLGIPFAGVNFEEALSTLKPDIVAVATPGGAHFEPVMAALEAGCHIYCDKPLAATPSQAKLMYQKAVAVGVKTAYAASYCYQPHALFAQELIAEGAIGEPLEVECVSHFNLDPLIPFGWSHRLEDGGGRLNNNFTHKLSIVESVLGGRVSAVSGEVRNDMPQAPLVSGVHDFRYRRQFSPSSADEPGLKWGKANAEWSYTVLAHIDPQQPVQQPVSAVFRHSALQPRFSPDYIAFYGREGAIYIQGHYAQGPLSLSQKRGSWVEMPLPARILHTLPDVEDDTQRNWNQLARKFVADIRGQGDIEYQTFQDGWIYQEIIEFIRNGDGWMDCSGFYTKKGSS